MSSCAILQSIKAKIDAGMDPDASIPYEIPITSMYDYLEFLNYAVQVLPEGNRKEEARRKLEEVIEDVRWTESK